jgi:tetratricopeptide (TPR) repeat protein
MDEPTATWRTRRVDTVSGDHGGFGSSVRHRRVTAGLTQEQLAEMSGLSVRTISDIERGRATHPHRSSVELLARVLDLEGRVGAQLARGTREAARLAEMRLQALETRIDADLHLGRHADVIGELEHLVATHPLRERLRAQLMLALYRDGRQAEALAAYRQARQMLIDELGTEPGTGLRELHQQILTADPALAVPAVSPGPADSVPTVPHQLPAGVRHFTGRVNELAALTGLLEQAGVETQPTVVISAIGGTAGVGKTALAVRWAHQVAARFPDGQLYVNLRGYDPDQPVAAADALAGFLRALGVAGQDIPAELDERAARYRSLLAGKRLLVVADNAGSEAQVRPLLPGDPGCVALVTSRDPLAGLVARDGARRVDLGLLPPGDATGLLRALIGRRAAADTKSAAALADQCSRLPLALRVAAERAAAHPAHPLADLVGELADEQRRLDLLDAGGDPQTAVRAVFSWSYEHLGSGAGRLLRLLGLLRGRDVTIGAAASLAGCRQEQAGRFLNELTAAYLVAEEEPGRFTLHDLLRLYSAERADQEETPATRAAAIHRALTWYLHTATAAAKMVNPRRRHVDLPAPPPGCQPLVFGAYEPALAWLDAERENLVAAVAQAAAEGAHEIAWKLPITLWDLFSLRGHFDEWIAAHETGITSAERVPEIFGQLWLLNNLSAAYTLVNRHELALSCCERALSLLGSGTGNDRGRASILHNLGLAQMRLGRPDEAMNHFSLALSTYRDLADPNGEGQTLNSIGETYRLLGRLEDAIAADRQALAAFERTGNRFSESLVLIDLAHAYRELGSYPAAISHAGRGLEFSREVGHRPGEAQALVILGHVLRDCGRPGEARQRWLDAYAIFAELGGPQAAEVSALLASLTIVTPA